LCDIRDEDNHSPHQGQVANSINLRCAPAPLRAFLYWRTSARALTGCVTVTPGRLAKTTASADPAMSALLKTSRPVRNAKQASSTPSALRERAAPVPPTCTSHRGRPSRVCRAPPIPAR
jgi:hypothetical protein